MRKMQTKQPNKRKAMLAKVHIAVSQLGYSDDIYRDILHQQFKVKSASQLNDAQLDELLKFFRSKGWKNKNIGKKPIAKKDSDGITSAAQEMKIIEGLLTAKAKHENKPIPWGYAKAILKKVCVPEKGPERMEWASAEQLRRVRIALIYDAKRKGYYEQF